MPSPLPYFQFFHKEWLASSATRRMTLAERSLYMDLLCYQWEDGFIPDNPAEIARMVSADKKEVIKAWPRVRQQFHEIQPGRLANPRMASDRDAIMEKVEHLQNNGRKGGRPPKPKENQKVSREKPKGFEKLNQIETKSKPIPEPEPYIVSNETPPQPPKGCEEIWLLLPESHRNAEVADAWQCYRSMRRQKGRKSFTEQGLKAKANLLGEYEPHIAALMLTESVRQEWDGIFPLRSPPQANGKPLKPINIPAQNPRL